MLDSTKLILRTAAVTGLALLAACTSSQSQMETAGEMMAPPQVVIVDTFATSPDEVKLDEGLSTEVEEAIGADRGTSRTEQEVEAGRQVADAIADKLVVEIRDMGLQAERGSAVPAGTQNAILIKGQLVSIDEGNRTERVIVGLGAGRSDVRAHIQVYEVTPAGSQLIDTIEVDGKSGLTPGMAETMGVGGLDRPLAGGGAVGGGMHVVSESHGRRRGRRCRPGSQGHRQAARGAVCRAGLDDPCPEVTTWTATPERSNFLHQDVRPTPSRKSSMPSNRRKRERALGGLLLISAVAGFVAASSQRDPARAQR